MLKLIIDEITDPISHIVNGSITGLIFPKQWKIFKISPIHKTATPIELSDYKPISILPALPKVNQRIFSWQMIRKISLTKRNTIWLSQKLFNKHSCNQVEG